MMKKQQQKKKRRLGEGKEGDNISTVVKRLLYS